MTDQTDRTQLESKAGLLAAKARSLLQWIEGEHTDSYQTIARELRDAIVGYNNAIYRFDLPPYPEPEFIDGELVWGGFPRQIIDIGDDWDRTTAIDLIQRGCVIRVQNKTGAIAIWRDGQTAYSGRAFAMSKCIRSTGGNSIGGLLDWFERESGIKSRRVRAYIGGSAGEVRMTDFGEPWKYERQDCSHAVIDANGNDLIVVEGYNGRPYGATGFHDPEHARRAAACVNFLRGVSTEELERILKCGRVFCTLPGFAVDYLHNGDPIEQRHLDDYADPPVESRE